MLMLNYLVLILKIYSRIPGDRTMLMLNYLVLILKIYSRIPGDRTMLMLNRSKINILFLHYILYILIFQSLIEILPADFSFMPILFNA